MYALQGILGLLKNLKYEDKSELKPTFPVAANSKNSLIVTMKPI